MSSALPTAGNCAAQDWGAAASCLSRQHLLLQVACSGCYIACNNVQYTKKIMCVCRKGLRTSTSIVVETAQCFSTHHCCVLVGYGAHAVCPYLAFETCRQWRLSSRCLSVLSSASVSMCTCTVSSCQAGTTSGPGRSSSQLHRGCDASMLSFKNQSLCIHLVQGLGPLQRRQQASGIELLHSMSCLCHIDCWHGIVSMPTSPCQWIADSGCAVVGLPA